jgi:hypothetical protein
MKHHRRQRQRTLFKFGIPILTIILVLVLVELLGEIVLRVGPRFGSIRFILANYYLMHERKIVQFEPECAQYDPELTYRLRPGIHNFANREFDTTLSINSFGLRDSEEALVAPEIIVLGDSFAMGWGVESSECFESILESTLGRSTLNAAISSYGTAREMVLLQKLDRTALRYVIVQYCSNDHDENVAYVKNWRLDSLGEEQYLQIRHDYLRAIQYVPLKRAATLLPMFWAKRHGASDPLVIPQPRPPTKEQAEQAKVVCKIFAHNLPLLGGDFKLILLHLDYPRQLEGNFTMQVGQELQKSEYAFLRKRLFLVRGHHVLNSSDFFPLDMHFKKSGHRKIGKLLADSILRLEQMTE